MKRWTTALTMLVACTCWYMSSRVEAGQPLLEPDCPLAFQPYSADTVLFDLLINPATRTVVDQDAPALTADNFSTHLPSFATIVTPRSVAARLGIPDTTLTRLDRDLAAVPMGPEAARARCARYDETPPELPRNPKRPVMLVFSKVTGFRHDAVDTAKTALKAMGERTGWTILFIDNAAVFNPGDLRRFDAVIWNNVSGDVLTVPQEKAFKSYMENGGGFAAFHGSGGDPYYVWDWYADTLLGARFRGHTLSPHFQSATVIIDDPKSAIVRGLGDGWSLTEEWYSFKSNPRFNGAHVLATIDESAYSEGNASLRMGDHPIAWTRCVGNGRAFYTAIGHRPEYYTEVHTVRLLERGIAWAAGLGTTSCQSGHEVDR